MFPFASMGAPTSGSGIETSGHEVVVVVECAASTIDFTVSDDADAPDRVDDRIGSPIADP
jgi:hypothetical protein